MKHPIPFLILATVLLTTTGAWAQAPTLLRSDSQTSPAALRWGFSPDMIGHSLSPRQVEVGLYEYNLKLKVTANLGFEIHQFRDWPTLKKSLNSGAINYPIVSSYVYLKEEKTLPVKPLVTAFYSDNKQDTFSVVVRRDGGIQHTQQLTGRPIQIFVNGPSEVVKLWIAGFTGERVEHMRFNYVQSPPKAILPIFFKKQDIAIVPTSSFEVQAELNPQIRLRMKELVRSPSLPNALIVVRTPIHEHHGHIVQQAALDSNKSRSGKQVAALTRFAQIEAYKAEHTAGIRQVLAAYKYPLPEIGTPRSIAPSSP